MKLISAVFLLILTTGAGVCSASTPGEPVETEKAELADAGAKVQGTLNLNIGRTQKASGGPIVNSGAGAGSDGLIVAPQSTGGNFEDVPGLDIQLSMPADALLEAREEAPSSEDEIVRLPPQN
ncbi:MAG: hypothetical protein ACO33A_02885 [Hyphomonas sp.]